MKIGRAGFLASAIALQAVAGMAMAQEVTGVARIIVTGEGRSDARPDMATITVGVSSQAVTARAALDDNTARLAKVLDQLKAAGIADRDLQTSGLNLGPVIDYSAQGQARVTGYQVSNQLTVRVRALDNLGTILDQTVSDGANEFRGLGFALSEPGPAMDAARVGAVKDARRKAEMMAEAAGVKLGKVMSISEQVMHAAPIMFARSAPMMAEAAPVPVAEGEVSYTVTVQMEWQIEQ